MKKIKYPDEITLANQALELSEKRFERISLVARHTTHLVVITNQKGEIEWVNEAFKKQTGYKLKDIKGKKPGSFLQGPDTDLETVSEISKKIHRGEHINTDIVNYTAWGKKYWVNIKIDPLLNLNQEIEGFIAIQSDITREKEKENQLNKYLNYLKGIDKIKNLLIKEKSLLKTLTDSIRILGELTGADKVCLYRIKATDPNEKLKQIACYSKDQSLSHLNAILFSDKNFSPDWLEQLQQLKSLKLPQVQMSSEEKKLFQYRQAKQMFLIPIYHQNKSFGFLGFEWLRENKKLDASEEFMLKDVAYAIGNAIYKHFIQKILYKSRKKLIKLNQKANKELNSFFYSASHDLRRPITTSMGLINLYKLEKNPREKLKFVQLIEKSLQKLNTLNLDLIHIAKNKVLPVSQIEKIDFRSLIDSVLEEFSYYENFEKIKKEISVKQIHPFWSDIERIKAILSNLLSNAIQYCNPLLRNPLIVIRVISEENLVKIEIIDNGLGINKAYLPYIFDLFFRANETRSGAGLGLYIVKETLQKIKGSIRVESEEGLGTKFHLELPSLENDLCR